MMYELINHWQTKASITQLCRVFGTSRSGYYAAKTKVKEKEDDKTDETTKTKDKSLDKQPDKSFNSTLKWLAICALLGLIIFIVVKFKKWV